MPRDKIIKLSTDSYDTLDGLVEHKRKKAQALENLIKILEKAAKDDKYLMVDLLERPEAVMLLYNKKFKKEDS